MSPHVEILYFEGCPNHEPARALVERVARQLGLTTRVELVRVPDADAAHELRFLGSPTIRVNGRDVEPGADDRRAFVFGCRLYRGEGELTGRPDESWVRRALTEAAG